ncbi:hypothetical protein MASR2M15_23770 [Anaerolineales bacterium]
MTRNIEQQNFHHLVVEIAWFGLAFASTSRFLQFFALRYGASANDLAYLTALPAILLFIGTTISPWWRKRYPTSVSSLYIPAMGQRMAFVLPIFAPLFPHGFQVSWIILSAMIPAFSQGISSIMFTLMMRENTNGKDITRLVTQRHFTFHVGVVFGAMAYGLMLEAVPFPYNYQLMFAGAAFFAFLSQWHLTKIKHKETTATEQIRAVEGRATRHSLLRSHKFLSLIAITLTSYVTYFSVFAMVTLHLERVLGATEGFMAIFGVVELVSAGVTAVLLRPIVERFGNRMVISFAMMATALSAIMIALSPDLPLTLIGAFLTGAGWSGAAIGIFGYFAENSSPADINAAILFHQVVFASMFVGPLIGSNMVEAGMATVSVLLFGGFLRLGAAAVIGWMPFLQQKEPA